VGKTDGGKKLWIERLFTAHGAALQRFWPRPIRPQSDVWIYSGRGTPPLLPRPPEPYRTVSETFSY
jgi:hypothetical protein